MTHVEVANLTTAFLDTIGTAETGFFLTLILFTGVIVLYSLLIFYFYKFLAKKNIIELNLGSHNKYETGAVFKIVATIFYVLEYVIILPFITFLWFAILSILLVVLSEGLLIEVALLISAALISSVRITSYISEDLSRDLAKMLPLTLLGVALTRPGFFDMSALITRFSEIPMLFSDIFYYLVFIIVVELIMRFYEIFETSVMNREKVVDEEYQA